MQRNHNRAADLQWRARRLIELEREVRTLIDRRSDPETTAIGEICRLSVTVADHVDDSTAFISARSRQAADPGASVVAMRFRSRTRESRRHGRTA